MKVRDLACGRAGDKGSTLDLTVVARDEAAYALLERRLDAETVRATLGAPDARRHAVPGLLALKYVLPGALAGGTYASLRAGMHWQKAAIGPVLELEVDGDA